MGRVRFVFLALLAGRSLSTDGPRAAGGFIAALIVLRAPLRVAGGGLAQPRVEEGPRAHRQEQQEAPAQVPLQADRQVSARRCAATA